MPVRSRPSSPAPAGRAHSPSAVALGQAPSSITLPVTPTPVSPVAQPALHSVAATSTPFTFEGSKPMAYDTLSPRTVLYDGTRSPRPLSPRGVVYDGLTHKFDGGTYMASSSSVVGGGTFTYPPVGTTTYTYPTSGIQHAHSDETPVWDLGLRAEMNPDGSVGLIRKDNGATLYTVPAGQQVTLDINKLEKAATEAHDNDVVRSLTAECAFKASQIYSLQQELAVSRLAEQDARRELREAADSRDFARAEAERLRIALAARDGELAAARSERAQALQERDTAQPLVREFEAVTVKRLTADLQAMTSERDTTLLRLQEALVERDMAIKRQTETAADADVVRSQLARRDQEVATLVSGEKAREQAAHSALRRADILEARCEGLQSALQKMEAKDRADRLLGDVGYKTLHGRSDSPGPYKPPIHFIPSISGHVREAAESLHLPSLNRPTPRT